MATSRPLNLRTFPKPPVILSAVEGSMPAGSRHCCQKAFSPVMWRLSLCLAQRFSAAITSKMNEAFSPEAGVGTAAPAVHSSEARKRCVGRTPLSIAFDVGFELNGIATAASTTVKERRLSAA